MSKPRSIVLRDRAMMRLAVGVSFRSIATALSIAPPTVAKRSRRQFATVGTALGQTGDHGPRRISRDDEDSLPERIGAPPFTLQGLVEKLPGRATSAT